MAMTQTLAAPNGNFLVRIGQGIADFFVAVSKANARTEELESLQAMSDEQLAKQGLTRDTIVHHVFRDVLYL